MWTGAFKHGPLAAIFFLFIFGILVAGTSWGGLQVYRWIGPQQEAARHEVFKESQSYQDGKVTALNRLRQQHVAADGEAHRCALRSTALHEASTAPDLPDDLDAWITELREDDACAR